MQAKLIGGDICLGWVWWIWLEKKTACLDEGSRGDCFFMEKILIALLPIFGFAVMARADELGVIETSKGTLVVEFWPDVAPKTVENFKKLAREGFYDGTLFHRIIKGFMAQGGDPLTKLAGAEERWGTGGPGYRIDAEFNDRKHERGVLSMARSAYPNSAGSQFFLMFAAAPHLDGAYTGFGKVIKGDEVLSEIEKTRVTISGSGERSKPLERVEVKKIRIVPREEVE